jgi:mannitol-1-phosphate/altronate dehydrogenase
MMNGREVVVVKLVKRITKDQVLEVRDDLFIGEKYIVYKEPFLILVIESDISAIQLSWQQEMYEVVDGGWLPTELLEIVK